MLRNDHHHKPFKGFLREKTWDQDALHSNKVGSTRCVTAGTAFPLGTNAEVLPAVFWDEV